MKKQTIEGIQLDASGKEPSLIVSAKDADEAQTKADAYLSGVRTVTARLRFRVYPGEFEAAVARHSGLIPELAGASQAEQIELLVTSLDVIALAAGRPVGWLELGLERL